MKRRNIFKAALAAAGLTLLDSPANYANDAPDSPKVGKPKRPYIETADGTSLFYQDWGAGRPLVFAAPWGLNSNWWEYQVPFLSENGFRCITYDRRGHGKSDSPSYGYDFDILASDLHTLIDYLDLKEVTLVGHSMGCAELVRYLTKYGSTRVTKLIMIGTITPFLIKTTDNPAGLDAVLFEKGRERLMDDRPHQIVEGAAGFFSITKNKVSEEILKWWAEMMIGQCSMNVMLTLHKAFTTTDFRQDLVQIKIPTLFIHGESDTSALPALTLEKSHPLISRSIVKTYADAGHGLVVTHKDRVNRDIVEFVL